MSEWEKIRRLDDQLRAKHPELSDGESGTLLTMERIAGDCRIKRGSSNGWIFLILLICVEVFVFFRHGMQALLNNWYVFLPGNLLCIFFIVLARRKGRKLEKEILQGDIRLICSPLNDKEVEESLDTDIPDTYYLLFNKDAQNGRYTYRTDSHFYSRAVLGEEYYLVLRKDRKGKETPIYIYPAQTNPPDSQLREILARDAHLTGQTVTMEEERKAESRKWAETKANALLLDYQDAKSQVSTISAEERETVKAKLMQLVKRRGFLQVFPKVVNILFAPVGVILYKTGFADAQWYWHLLLTLGYLLVCVGPVLAAFRLDGEIYSLQLQLLATGERNLPKNRNSILLFILSGMAGLFNFLMMLALWGIL